MKNLNRKNITLNFDVDGYGVKGNFDVELSVTSDDWKDMTDDEQFQLAKEAFNENVDWSWIEK